MKINENDSQVHAEMTEGLQMLLSSHISELRTELIAFKSLANSLFLFISQQGKIQNACTELLGALENKKAEMNETVFELINGQLLDLFGKSESFTSHDFSEISPNVISEHADQIVSNLDQLVKNISKLVEASSNKIQPAVAVIVAQEDERKRISREIHDGPAQSLVHLTMRIDFCIEQIHRPSLLKTELLDLKELIIKSLKDIRRFIFDLRPMALDDLGLIPTLEQFIAGFKLRTKLLVHMHIDGQRIPLTGEKELAIFRVIQEALNNAYHHATPQNVHIFLVFEAEPNRISCTVKDDGKGFNVEEIRKAYPFLKKLGLISMEERIRLIGGTIEFFSIHGEGTTVSFSVPL